MNLRRLNLALFLLGILTEGQCYDGALLGPILLLLGVL